jgi:hypothetical protein
VGYKFLGDLWIHGIIFSRGSPPDMICLYFFEVESGALHVIKVSPLLDRIFFDRPETGALILLKKIVIHFSLAHVIDPFVD